MSRVPVIEQQFFDNAGDPLIDGLLNFFESGTSTRKDTFKDVNLTIKNSNPVILTAAGFLENCFYNGSAKIIITDSNGANSRVRDPITSTDSSSFGANWDAETIYGLNETVTDADILYISIVGNNSGNTPASSPGFWSHSDIITRFNASQNYDIREPVIATHNNLYISKVVNNLGNDPASSPTEWSPPVPGFSLASFADYDASISYGIGGQSIVKATDNNLYVSISAANLNNEPSANPTNWTLFSLVDDWNADQAYITGNMVKALDDYVYVAQQATTGDDPVTDTAGTNWGPRPTQLLALKADLASPTFTGDPKTPTASPGDNDTTISSTAFVEQRASNLAASDTTSGAFADARIPSLNASKTNAGTFADARIPNLAASKITSGAFADARIPSLNASKTNAGTFADARIPNLNASKITAGIFNALRIPAATTSVKGAVLKNRLVNTGGGWVFEDQETGFKVQIVTLALNVNVGVSTSVGSDTWPEAFSTFLGLSMTFNRTGGVTNGTSFSTAGGTTTSTGTISAHDNGNGGTRTGNLYIIGFGF